MNAFKALPWLTAAVALAIACSSSESAGPSRQPPISTQPTTQPDAATPFADGGCFDGGAPSTTAEYLNQCNANCFPFDNAARIEGFKGVLPPLN